MLVSSDAFYSFVRQLGKGPGIVGLAYVAQVLGFILALVHPNQNVLFGFAGVVGAAVAFVSIGGAVKATKEARYGSDKPPA